MYRESSYLDSKMARVLPPEGEPIADLDKLVHTMGQVAIAAPEVGLPQFRYGFHGYQRVTAAVTQALDGNTFKYPEKMAHTMPYFAERAFAPIRHHINGDVEKVGAWSPMLYGKAAQNALPSTAMVDFLGFHVVYDLPFTLRETNTQPDHHDDYTEQINIILSNVARELLPEYAEVRPSLKRMRAEDIGLWFVLQDLFRARDDAWKTFEQMRLAEDHQHDDTSPHTPNCQRCTIKRPKTLTQIEEALRNKASGRMLSTKRAANFVIRQATRIPDHPWKLPHIVLD